MSHYYDSCELADFPKITEFAKEQGGAFFEYYGKAMAKGALDEKTKALIALAVAVAENCPYCIDAYTNTCLSLGISPDAMFEAIHVSAAMKAGITLAHSTQARKIIKKKEM